MNELQQIKQQLDECRQHIDRLSREIADAKELQRSMFYQYRKAYDAARLPHVIGDEIPVAKDNDIWRLYRYGETLVWFAHAIHEPLSDTWTGDINIAEKHSDGTYRTIVRDNFSNQKDGFATSEDAIVYANGVLHEKYGDKTS